MFREKRRLGAMSFLLLVLADYLSLYHGSNREENLENESGHGKVMEIQNCLKVMDFVTGHGT